MATPDALVKGFDRSIESYNETERYPLQLTRLVHENLSIVISFAYSHKPLSGLIEDRFHGYWKYLEKAIFEIGEERANRAIAELALLIRTLDDEEGITNFDKQCGMNWNCGRLIKKNGEEEELSFREFSNKIIHAKTFKWEFSSDDPKLICYARNKDNQKWIRAEVDLIGIAAFCGRLMS